MIFQRKNLRALSFAKASVVVFLAGTLAGCQATSGSLSDLFSAPAQMVPPTKTGIVLESLPKAARPLDVAVYSFPDLTGQNKENDNFALFSHALTQGGADILADVLTKAGGGGWFDVVERNGLQPLLQERQIIQNTRLAVLGSKAPGLPALRFAGVILEGGIIGYDTNETTGGIGANYLGIGADTQYRQDVVTVALRAISVQSGRILASVTTTKTVYSTLMQASVFKFVAVDKIFQAEGGYTKNSPVTLAVRESIQLAVYALIFEGVKNRLWKFQDEAAGAAFMKELDQQQRATSFTVPINAATTSPSHP